MRSWRASSEGVLEKLRKWEDLGHHGEMACIRQLIKIACLYHDLQFSDFQVSMLVCVTNKHTCGKTNIGFMIQNLRVSLRFPLTSCISLAK